MTVASTIDVGELARRAEALPGSRTVIALAGAPGSGKSTVAERLLEVFESVAPGSAAILPMDGFHYDDAVLRARGLLDRKGAPDTFDVGGLQHLLSRLRRNTEAEVAVPVFDRSLEISRAGARLIARSVRFVIVEGNYLLLAAAPWNQLRESFDISVFVAVEEQTLRRRLNERWRSFALSPSEIERKVELNDLPNGRRVVAESVAPDFSVDNNG